MSSTSTFEEPANQAGRKSLLQKFNKLTTHDMGDIAEMMINGDLCEGCGAAFLPDDLVYTTGGEKLYRYKEIEDWNLPTYHEDCGLKKDEDLPVVESVSENAK